MSGPPPIAVVGLACRYPDADGPDRLWETVIGRRRAFRLVPGQRLGDGYRGTGADQTYVTHAGLLRGWEFDRHRFEVPGPLFRAVDQTHWLALQTCAEALSDAGFPDAAGLDRDRAGVILGNSLTGEFSRAAQLRLRWPFVQRAAATALAGAGVPDDRLAQALDLMRDLVRDPFPEPGDETLAGALANTIAGRVCNHFDLHGGGYTVDGACSSSLLAVITACRALASGELDFALAGGVDLSLDPFELVGFSRLGALAEGPRMRVYDADPTGFLPGEGCGVVALMRADDARRAGLREYAVVSGWGTSSDGSGGLTRPEVSGVALALERAHAMAGVDPAAVDLVEGHGTGTAVGDRVELTALNRVRAGAGRRAALGSVKANIGHTKAAAGVAGLIKAALAVHHRVVPPTTGCEEPHPLLADAGSTLRVPAEPEPWSGRTAVAGVSSMGFGGINAHVVLSGGDRAALGVPEPLLRWSAPAPEHEIVLLTAADRDELASRLAVLAERARALSAAELHDLAATRYRAASPEDVVRCALVANSPERLARAAASALTHVADWTSDLLVDRGAGVVLARRGTHRVGLLFPGQAAPVRTRLDAWTRDLAVPAVPGDVRLTDGATATEVAQPAIVRQSLAALALLDALGCEPVAAVGHSLGELTALVWAGALSAEEGLRLAAVRGRVMAEHGRAGTALASIGLPVAALPELVDGVPVTVAGFNGPDQVTVGGEAADVRLVVDRATRVKARAKVLAVSHAFHTEAMRPAAAPFAEALRGVPLRPPRRTVFSTVTGRRLAGDADLRALLVDQVTAPVRFADAVAALSGECDLLVEVGPGTTLTSLVSGVPAVSLDAGGGGREHAIALAALAAASACDLDRWFGDRAHRHVDLDTPITLLANPTEVGHLPVAPTPEPEPAVGEDPLLVLREHLSRTLELPLAGLRPDRRLLGDLHLNSLQVVQLVAEVAELTGRRVPALPPSFETMTVGETAELVAAQPPVDAATGVAEGVGPWVRSFEHRWEPWTGSAPAGGVRWTVPATAPRWLHDAARDSDADDAARHGLAVWLDDDADVAEIAGLLRTVAAQGPDVLAVLHRGHPAAAAVARSAGIELASCTAASLDLSPVADGTGVGHVSGTGIGPVSDAAASPELSPVADGTGVVHVPGTAVGLASGAAASLDLSPVPGGTAVDNVPGAAVGLAPGAAASVELPSIMDSAAVGHVPGAADVPALAGVARQRTVGSGLVGGGGSWPDPAGFGLDGGQWPAPAGGTDVRLSRADLDLAVLGGDLRLTPAGGVERLTTTVRPPGRDGALPIGAGDVCLVSGGVDGITARCAEALALRTGCVLVFLGRSAREAPRVRAGLAVLDGRITAHYVACDVTEPDRVRDAVAVAGAHGPVRALLHGAGVNEPRPIGSVTGATLAATLGPKVTGLRNLLDAAGERLALVVGFGSIIGRRGLPGQAEYCVANDWLRVDLERWADRHPSCRTRVLEWSVWSEVGMGERMGVLGLLRDQGIAPVDPAAGVAAMLDALGEGPVTRLVTGRFPDGPTLTVTGPPGTPLRFSTDVVVRVAGVEAVLAPVVSTGSDPYLDDHRIDGVPVLPAVAGLEAMAQAAASVIGDRDGWEFTDLDLSAPVVVDRHEPRALRIAALARNEPDPAVDVVLRDGSDGFTTDRFRATARPAPPAPHPLTSPPTALPPTADHTSAPPAAARTAAAPSAQSAPPLRDAPHPFYGPLLFHSGRMRCLVDYEHLSAFRVRAWVRAGEERWFSEYLASRLLLGDLGAQDAGIHVLLACLPHRRALPVAAERITVWRRPTGLVCVDAEERSHDGDDYLYDVRLSDQDGTPIARWDGLRLRAYGPRPWAEPPPAPLVGPLLSRRLAELGLADRLELVTTEDTVVAHAATPVGVARADDGRSAVARALLDLGLPDDAGLVVEKTTDGLLVCGTPAARVVAFTGTRSVAVALPRKA